MKIFKKAGQPLPTKVQKRVMITSTPDLVIWVETLLPTIGRNVVHHNRDGELALEEAEQAAGLALIIVQELKRRLNSVS